MSEINKRNSTNKHGSVRSYSVGFLLSVILTLFAYTIAAEQLLTGWSAIFVLSSLAIIQMIVQLVFFLHLGRESKPKWNTMALLFAVGVVIILVFGSLWIMRNLNYHGMTPEQTDTYLLEDEGARK